MTSEECSKEALRYGFTPDDFQKYRDSKINSSLNHGNEIYRAPHETFGEVLKNTEIPDEIQNLIRYIDKGND